MFFGKVQRSLKGLQSLHCELRIQLESCRLTNMSVAISMRKGIDRSVD